MPGLVHWVLVLVCSCSLPGHALELRVVDQHGEPLQHAVVTARLHSAAGQPPMQTEISQTQQQFLPRVTVVRRGSDISFPNRDTTQHHVYSFSPAKSFEIELYKGDMPQPVTFDAAGIVALGCNIHDWMLGYVYVTTDDAYSVSSDAGFLTLEAELADLEQVTVWHPAAASAEPQDVPVIGIEVGVRGYAQVVLQTGPDDPLEFEIDPLQQLFIEASR